MTTFSSVPADPDAEDWAGFDVLNAVAAVLVLPVLAF